MLVQVVPNVLTYSKLSSSGSPHPKLVYNCGCGGSTYYMLKYLEQLEPALVLLAADNNNIKNLYPNEGDWIIIKVN